MKKAISLILAFVLCLSLCACGKSEAVKNVETLIKAIGEVSAESGEAITAAQAAYDALSAEEQAKVSNYSTLSSAKVGYTVALIDAIGEVTFDSEPAILAAEEAYNALSDEEKVAVENYTQLTDAKTTLEFEQLRASLVGDWVALSDSVNTVFSLANDGTTTISGLEFRWELTEDKKYIRLGGTIVLDLDIGHIFEYTTLYNSELNGVMIRKEDAEQVLDKYLTVVELTPENYDKYIGESIYLGNEQNEWGEDGSSVFCFASKAYENGLIFIGVSSDFAIELDAENYSLTNNYHPYQPCPFGLENNTPISIARIKGSMTFISSEYVDGVKYSEDGSSRIITLIDGNTITDKCHAFDYNGNSYYKWAVDSNINF